MSLTIRQNGIVFDYFVEAEVVRDMETVTSFFSFVATTNESRLIPIAENSLVEILADGQVILTGYVEEYAVEYDDKQHNVFIKGRSLTSDLVDTTIGEVDFSTNVDLYVLCNLVASKLGLKTIASNVNFVNTLKYVNGGEAGETAFDFLNKYAKQFGIFLTDNEFGNLVLTQASSTKSIHHMKNKIGASNNNIKRGKRTTNLSGLYYKYIAQGQGTPINEENLTAQGLTFLAGFAIDDEIRKNRTLEFYTEEIRQSFDFTKRAKWEMSYRRARAFLYGCVVAGHSAFGKVYRENLVYTVNDDFANISEDLLCKKVVYRYDVESGSETELTFVKPNSFTLQSEKDKLILNPFSF